MKQDLQAEMLISAEAKRLADRYNKEEHLWIDMISQPPMSVNAKLLALWHLHDGLTFKTIGEKTNG